MRITGPDSEFMDGFHAAAKDDAAEFKRLDARIAKMERALKAIMEAAELGDTDACHELARLALT